MHVGNVLCHALLPNYFPYYYHRIIRIPDKGCTVLMSDPPSFLAQFFHVFLTDDSPFDLFLQYGL